MGNEKGGNPVTFHNCANRPAGLSHEVPAATLSLGSGTQRYIGLQRTQPKDRRSTTDLRDLMGKPGRGIGAVWKRSRIYGNRYKMERGRKSVL